MKVGLILECGPEGADIQVIEYLIRTFYRHIEEISSVALNNKPGLIANCGNAAAQLIVDGCDRVIVIWDLYPAWREDGQKPCLVNDRNAILHSLAVAGVAADKTVLVCIMEELEAWLIADGRALSKFLSTPAHPVSVTDSKKPESQRNPKKHLSSITQQHRGWKYEDRTHAIRIARHIPDLSKLRKSTTYCRFEESLRE
jgi:hypothetical protein